MIDFQTFETKKMIMTRTQFLTYLDVIDTMSREHNWPRKIIPHDPQTHFNDWLKSHHDPTRFDQISASTAVEYLQKFDITTVPAEDLIFFTEAGFHRQCWIIDRMHRAGIPY